MRKYIITPLLLLAITFSTGLKAQLNIELLGQLEYGDQLSNLTGWADGAGNEYAIVGTFDGTSIVDITDPTSPVEVQFIDGNNSIWREVRTWDHYAYVVTEADGGLLCIDLSELPGAAPFNYTECGVGLTSGHTVFCDENGFVHVFGSNLAGGGDIIFDATDNPLDPEYVGEVNDWYIHDGFVRGDTLWAGNIYNGWFSVWDVSDKASPVLMGQQTTPDAFTHNVWLTDDNNFLFSTDEVSNAVVASYDVSDLTDIKELDLFRANPGTNSIPHNTFAVGNFVVTAYYRDGVVITDATYPDNMIKVGEFDTSPFEGDGFNGAWGAWPYLPSGNIIVSDMEEGLFILGPEYVQACYIDGTVTDAATGAPIFDAEISFTAVGAVDATTNLTGFYNGGTIDPGTYDITFSKSGYLSETVTGVVLTSGVLTTVNAELDVLPTYLITGKVIDGATGEGIAGANVLFQNPIYNLATITDASGNFTYTAMYDDIYTAYAGKWSYVTNGEEIDVNPGGVYTLTLNKGYYDDYIFDFDWSTNTTTDVGLWEKGEPNGTYNGATTANAEDDVTDDWGVEAYVTGNLSGGATGTDDVDNGDVNLISPTMDLTTYGNPVISYYRWFYNGGGGGIPNDTLTVFVSNGIEEIQIDEIRGTSPDLSEWIPVEVNLTGIIDLTANMTVRFRTADQSATGHLVEAGVDKFYVYDEFTAAPTTAFTTDLTTGCAPLTVTFTDESISAAAWSWTFPGGTPATSTFQNPVVVYNTPGVYDVTLVASNMIGETSLTSTGVVTAELCNDINDTELSDLIAITPNPFSDFMVINITSAENIDAISITDITGRELAIITIAKNTEKIVTGGDFPAGIYFVNLMEQGKIVESIKAVKAL